MDPNIPALGDVEQAADDATFAAGLESIHDLVHVWFGQRATMFSLDRAVLQVLIALSFLS